MPTGCILPMSAIGAHTLDAPRSQTTQTAIATSATGTQCGLMLLVSTSSQTEAKFPVREVDNAKAGAWVKFSPSPDVAHIVAEAQVGTCFGAPHSCKTGSFCNASKEILSGQKLHFGPSSQEHTHQTTEVMECGSKMPYVCTVCKKAFGKNRNLNVHMRVHTSEKPYVCRTCDKSFTQRHSLVTHERLHSGKRLFVCGICQRSFTRKAYFVRHEQSHSDVKPSACNIDKCKLVAHEQLHSEERPYMCSICQKSFTKRAYLVAHERLHSNERPYACGMCQKSFAKKGDLGRHERLHSGKRL